MFWYWVIIYSSDSQLYNEGTHEGSYRWESQYVSETKMSGLAPGEILNMKLVHSTDACSLYADFVPVNI